MVELVGIELEAFGGREVIFEEDDWESAAEILSEVEGPCRFGGAGRDRTGGLIVANDGVCEHHLLDLLGLGRWFITE